MGTICAWCQSWIEKVAASRHAGQPASHGICAACLQRQIEATRQQAQPQPLRAA